MKITNYIYLLLLASILIIGCNSKTDLNTEGEKKQDNIVSKFLSDVNSLESDTNTNPIVAFKEFAEEIAEDKIIFSKKNIKKVLIKSKEFSNCVIITGNHTIVKILSFDNCQQSGSWKACMPKCEGYIKKGKLNYKSNYMNNIIGIPDNQERVAYFFNTNQSLKIEEESDSNSEKIIEKKVESNALNQNSKIYDYELYKVTLSDKRDDVGSIINVYDKLNHSSFTIDDGAIYFEELIDNYMILDAGTSIYRTMIIYDLTNQNIVFESGYYDDLEFNDSKIEFKNQVQLTNEQAKPDCPQELLDIGYGIGYSEKLIFDLTTLKLKRTGIYECQYFE